MPLDGFLTKVTSDVGCACEFFTDMVLYAGGRPVPSCKSPMQASMVGVSNSLWNYPSRPMFVLVAICSLAMC